jgi:hemoglobin
MALSLARPILLNLFPPQTKLNDLKLMKTTRHFSPIDTSHARMLRAIHFITLLLFATTLVLAVGCRGRSREKQSTDFFTSGSREADQRATQRMARDEQLTGSGEGAGERGAKKASTAVASTNGAPMTGTNQAAQVAGKLALFDRLGGEAGISNIVADFTPRVMQDPRVNWERKDVKRGGFSIHSGQSVTWTNSPQNVALLEKHFVQFLSLATGGPAHYEGKDIKSSHAARHISNPEFDAAIGDLKSSLDKLQIPNKEQKELLAIIESTRPQIVTQQ